MSLKVDVLLPNSSQYEVLHHFAKKLYEAFSRQGYRARLLHKQEYFKTIFKDPPAFTIGFNGAPVDESKEFLCDKAFVPHVSCLVDPPYRFMNLQSSPYILITCDDRACTEMFKTVQHPNYYFLPHAVERELAPDPLLQRDYDIVFLGSYIDGERHRLKWRGQFPEVVWKAMEGAAEGAMADERLHFMQAFLDRINQAFTTEGAVVFDLAEALQELELYVKARDRTELIRSIKSSQVHVFGSGIDGGGWEGAFSGQDNIVIHPAVPYPEALHIMKRSKIVLNSGLKSTYGAHERVFSGLAAGAAVLTSSNPYLTDNFEDEESILLYRHEELGLVDEKLRHYLHHDREREELVRKGRDLVIEHHTWDARVNSLMPEIMPVLESL